MVSFARRFFFFSCLIAALASLAFGQLTQTGIHGFVRDPSGAVIPGASVKAQDMSTTIVHDATSAADGGFVFPNLVEGTYSVTAVAKGFETTVVSGIVVDAGRTTDISVGMKVGATTETVEVSGAAAQLETSSNEIGLTVNNNYVQNLPYSSRDSLNFATYAPGFVSSDFNNLPNASMNISIDGMDNNSERFKSGGTSFYAFAPERIDAVEEVTVSTTGTGADSAGFGAMNIRFQIKRGTNQYHFSVGEQFANEDLNSNSFFGNLRGQPIAKTRQNNPYGSLGGPLVPFIPSLKHKLFFFAYFESQPQPGSGTSTTTVLSPAAQAGNFTYLGTDGVQHTVNVLTVAQQAGYPYAIDPTIQTIFNAMNASESKASGFLAITNEFYGQTMEWSQPNSTFYLFPAARVDYQITPKVAYHGSWSIRHENISPSTPPYPGLSQYAFGNDYKINAYVATSGIDWSITPHLINNATFGVQSNGEYFYYGSNPQQFAPYGNRMIYMPTVGTANFFNPTIPTTTPYIRNNPVSQLRDDLTWIKGKHTITMGGTLKHSSFWESSCSNTCGVPGYQIGLPSGDPFASTLQNALPAINTSVGDQNLAADLYAALTGTVSSISGGAGVDEHTKQYVNFAYTPQRFAYTYGGLYIQDSFRVTPHLTLNLGFRWELDGAIHDTNSIVGEPTGSNFYGMSNSLFQPGVFSSNTNPQLIQTNYPYSADLLNPAPLIGFAWTPTATEGLPGKIIGNNKTVLRAGAAMNYYNEGMNAISNPLANDANGCNGTGATQSATAVPGNPGFTTSGILLSQSPPALQLFPSAFGYPISQSIGVFTGGQAVCLINPNLKSPYTSNWNLSLQRELPGKFIVEVDYVGNKSTHMWHYQNQNEVNIFENGFLTQFQQAQANLSINQANGKGNTFINNGLAGQSALPIFQTAFGANGSNAALSNSSGFGSSTFVTDLTEGLAGSLANSLSNTATSTYYCRLVGSNFSPCSALGFTAATAYPANFFTANPYDNYLGYQNDNGNSNYNALQIILRKSLSHGFTVNSNFTWSHSFGTVLNSSDQTATYQWWTMRNGRLNYGPTPFDRRFVFNAFWTYDLPFGKGRLVNITNGVLERVLGGWTLGGIETISTGGPSLLSSSRYTFNYGGASSIDPGGVEFGTLTPNQLRNDLATIPSLDIVTSSGNLKSNVTGIAASNGAANPAYYGPNTIAGVLGTNVYVYGKDTYTLNMSLNKQVRIHDRLNIGFRMEALNFLNHPFFTSLGSTTSTGTTFGQVSSASGTRTVLLRAFVNF